MVGLTRRHLQGSYGSGVIKGKTVHYLIQPLPDCEPRSCGKKKNPSSLFKDTHVHTCTHFLTKNETYPSSFRTTGIPSSRVCPNLLSSCIVMYIFITYPRTRLDKCSLGGQLCKKKKNHLNGSEFIVTLCFCEYWCPPKGSSHSAQQHKTKQTKSCNPFSSWTSELQKPKADNDFTSWCWIRKASLWLSVRYILLSHHGSLSEKKTSTCSSQGRWKGRSFWTPTSRHTPV